uniref:Uncharacterized protein n=1 Tax=Romanomermis culicivorax TaxID=13658 RepID=A0A915JLU0_ROMCU
MSNVWADSYLDGKNFKKGQFKRFIDDKGDSSVKLICIEQLTCKNKLCIEDCLHILYKYSSKNLTNVLLKFCLKCTDAKDRICQKPPMIDHDLFTIRLADEIYQREKIAIEKLAPEKERIAFKKENFAAKSSLLEAKTQYYLLQCRKLDIELPSLACELTSENFHQHGSGFISTVLKKSCL